MANYRKQIVEELKDIPEDDLSKIYEFIHWIKIKIVKQQKKGKTVEPHLKDPLDEVIGCCEGPGDLSYKHDFYLYGKGADDFY